ncbi:hypothetical protein GOODEAATRI_005445 [Goodea atripinnis]|uniref:Uncharacterized protein n=1 Tax=Goodea atripinnis TaxID=208336 RepID=A0ABV0PL98_9TELE
MTADNEIELKEAFQRAQKGHNNKAKLVASLKSRYNKLEDKTLFHEEFVHYLKYAMIVYKREPAVENVIDFVAKFAATNSHAVRFRVCQLINKLLGSMAENAQIDDDLFDRIHQAMLVRVTDKFLLKRFTLKRLPSHRELVYCSRVSMTLQVMFC